MSEGNNKNKFLSNFHWDTERFLFWFITIISIAAAFFCYTQMLNNIVIDEQLESSPTEEVVLKTEKIVALQDKYSQEGHYYLGFGYNETNPKYYFYKEANNGYVIDSVYAEDVIIRYDNNPRIETVGYKYVNKEDQNKSIHKDGTNGIRKTVIYCPEGSINNEFNLDLKP